jgi:hypothetical protein
MRGSILSNLKQPGWSSWVLRSGKRHFYYEIISDGVLPIRWLIFWHK